MKSLVAASLLLGSSMVVAECTRPDVPTIPKGSEADLAAMVEGQKAVKTYVAASEAYLDCLNKEGAEMANTDTDEQKQARIDEHNSSVDSMEAIAASFNDEIREYKAKNPSD